MVFMNFNDRAERHDQQQRGADHEQDGGDESESPLKTEPARERRKRQRRDTEGEIVPSRHVASHSEPNTSSLLRPAALVNALARSGIRASCSGVRSTP